MTLSVTAKSRTLTNGTANDATSPEASFVELYNNDAAIAAIVNAILATDSTTSTVDGKFIRVRNSFTGSPASGEHAGFEVERGVSTNVKWRWNETNDLWEFTADGTNYIPVAGGDAGELTIASGAVTAIGGYHTIDTESDAASDDLDTINGGVDGYRLLIQAENGARDVVIKHNTGNIYNPSGVNITLDDQYKSAQLVYSAALSKWVVLSSTSTSFPKGYINGGVPAYTSAATITLPAGLRVRSSDNTADIEVSSPLVVSLAASGALGLDTGSEASSTWYYVYLIKKSSDGTVSAVFSVTNESVSGTITQPSGYDLKRQLPIAIRNDGSSNIIPFVVGGGWPLKPYIAYRDYEDSSVFRVLNAGTSATFAGVSLTALIPPISKLASLNAVLGAVGSGTFTYIIPTGSGLSTGMVVGQSTTGYIQSNAIENVITNSSQSIDYKTGSSVTLFVRGFTVTEIS